MIATRLEAYYVGIDGSPSCFGSAYRHLVQQADAATFFQKIYTRGTSVGKLYALAGLRQVDPKTYDALAKARFLQSTELVDAIDGCVGTSLPIKDVAKLIATGSFPERVY